MSEKIRKGNIFILKSPISIHENQKDFIIPEGTIGVVIGPTIATGNKVTHLQLNAISPSGAIIDLKMAADELLSQFERGRASRDKSLDDWSVSFFATYRAERNSTLSYKGEEVASIHAIKDEGVDELTFFEGKDYAANALNELIALVNKEVDSKLEPLNILTFGDYYFKGYSSFLSLNEYVSLLSKQAKILNKVFKNNLPESELNGSENSVA